MASGEDGRFRRNTARVRTREMLAAGTRSGQPDLWEVVLAAEPKLLLRRFALAPAHGTYRVGRAPDCDLVVDGPRVSPYHLRLERAGDGWRLVDLGSEHGTFVNDRRVRACMLAHGDRVQLGGVLFRHLSGDDAEGAYAEAVHALLATDPLTRLANDRAFRDALEARVARARALGAPLALLLADVDLFKRVNDAHGHAGGDRVLRDIATLLRAESPAEATVARVGGEEFAVLLPDAPLRAGCALAERARVAVAAHPFLPESGPLRVTISLGVAALAEGETSVALFERADRRLYESKRDGRDCVSA